MKIIHLTAFFLLALTVSCRKTSTVTAPETPVSKTIRFRMAQGQDYSAPVYQHVQAEVKLTVSKENLQTGTNTVVWDTTFSQRSLRDYPATTNPLELQKEVTNILESKEAVRISRSVKYVHDFNHIQYTALGETIPSGLSFRLYDIFL